MAKEFCKFEMTTRGVTPRTFAKLIEKRYQFEVQGVLIDLAEWSKSKMTTIINSSRKRVPGSKSGNLASNIQVEKVSGGFGSGYVEYGVGNIQTLNSVAPYWQVLNSGKTVTGKRFTPGNGKYVPKGFFIGGNGGEAPTQGGEGGAWSKGGSIGGSSYSFKAKKFIEGINYIDITAQQANLIFQNELAKILGHLKV